MEWGPKDEDTCEAKEPVSIYNPDQTQLLSNC